MKRRLQQRFARIARLRHNFLNLLWDAVRNGVQTWSMSRPLPQRRFAFEALEERRVLATMFAVDTSNNLLTFDSATPGSIDSNVAITGLSANTTIAGIDVRPATGQLYAFGLVDDGATRTGQIYTLDPNGSATAVGVPFSTTLNDTDFWGMDFNPTVDRIRLTSREGQNLRVNPITGGLAATDTTLTTMGINGIAYDRNDAAATVTTLYGYRFDTDTIVTIGGIDGVPSPNTGSVSNIGSSGITALDSVTMDIEGGTGIARMTANSRLYTLNLATGAATDLGTIGNGLASFRGLATAMNIGSVSNNTVTINGTNNDDVIRVEMTQAGALLVTKNGTSTLYPDFASSPVDTIISIDTGLGNDHVTVDTNRGAVVRRIHYKGGSGDDSLTLQGGTATSNIYSIGPTADQGRSDITINGITQSLTFEGLEPVLDLVAGPLAVVGTDSDNAINYSVGSVATNGLVTIDNFESIEFSNKTTLTLNAENGDDTINLSNSNTPTGLTNIVANGGSLGANDTLIVNGTSGNDTINYMVSNTLGSGSVAIAGSATVNFTTTKALVLDGNGGTDALTVTSPSGHRTTITPGAAADSGSIESQGFGAGTASVPLTYAHIGAIGSVTIAGSGDIVEFNGTPSSDTFQVTGTTAQILNATSGFVTNLFNLTNVFQLELRGRDGDDTFNISGTLAALNGGVVVDGGNPSASDVLNLSVPTGAVAVNFGNNTVTGYGATVSMIGIETLNANANNNNATVQGTAGNDALDITPTGTDAVTFKLESSNPSVDTTPVVNLSAVGTTLTADGSTGNNSLTVNGTANSDSFQLSRSAGALTLARSGTQVITATNTFSSWNIKGGDGNDTFDVSEPAGAVNAIELNIDGGAGSNSLNLATNFVETYIPAVGNNGSLQGGAPINFSDVATAAVTLSAPSTSANITAGSGNNHVTLTGTATTTIVATVDNGTQISFGGTLNALTVNAGNGDDTIAVTPGAYTGTVEINGGAPTASDILIVNGTSGNNTINYNVSNTVGSGSVAIAGSATLNFTTTEALVIDGQGGTDALTVTSPSGHRTTITPGAAADSGSITSQAFGAGTASVPLTYAHIGATGSVTIAGSGDIIEFNGTSSSDTFNVTGTTAQIFNTTAGFVTNLFNFTNIFGLELRGLDGDDAFNITGTLATYLGGVTVDGGNPSASDKINLTGAIGAVNVGLADGTTGTNTQITGFGAPVTLIGIETANVNASSNSATVNGTAQPDSMTYTPTGANAASLVNAGLNTTFNFANVTGSLTLDGAGGADSITVNGTNSVDTINLVKGANTTVAVNSLLIASLLAATTEALSVNAGDGNDTINVSGTTASGQVINIQGGSPTSNSGSAADTLSITMTTAGTTAVSPGASPDAGAITSPDGTTEFSGIELISLTGAAGANTLNAQGTHNSDTMALQFLGGANRVWINDRAVTSFSNFSTVTLNGLFGDDKVSVSPVGLVGVTTINVNGGDPTASDELVVNGTSGNDTVNYTTSNTVGSGSVAITAAPVVNFTTTEEVIFDGQGGTDSLTFTTPAGGHREIFTPGTSPDSGRITSSGFGGGTQSVPLTYAHIGATGSITFAGAGASTDILEINGTNNSDTINVSGTTAQIVNATGGFVTTTLNTTGISALQLHGLDGDDQFNVSGALVSYTLGIFVDGGNPSASDVLNFTGNGGNVTQTFSSSTVSEVGSQTVTYSSIEVIDVNAATANLSVQASSGDDILEVTPTGANAATLRLNKTNPSIGATPIVNGSNIGTLNAVLTTGNDELIVNGSTSSESITITGALVTVGALETVNYIGAEALSVFGLQGNDLFAVTPGVTPIFIDGGDPIGTLPGDALVVNGAVGFFSGPENDEGGVTSAGGIVSYDHIESLTVTAIPGCPFLILGTNGDDDITVIARDVSTTVGADGVQDFTFSVNQGIDVVVLNQATLFIDAMAGDDDIVIRTAAPNEAAWDVDVRVAGGSPSIGAPLEADRLVLETPNGINGSDNIVFNPTGNDTGNLIIDKDNNGTYEAAGTDSLITFGSFVFNCPPATFTYTSTAGGVELVQVNGEGAPAVDDNLTINGTALDDTTVISPTGIGAGKFTSGASPQFSFQSFDNVTVNPGTGGFDRIEINGTAGTDTVTSNANTVTLGGAVTIGAGIDQLDINTFDGNDNVDLDLTVASLKKVISLGAGNDTANLLGVAVDPADPTIYGGDGDDTIIGSPNPDLIFGGSGNDVLVGAAGIDQIYGEAGNDIFGNASATPNAVADDAGNDLFNGGDGSDTFVWEPGDGSDTIEGGAGEADVLAFFGGAGAEVFNVFAKQSDPSRAILFRNAGNITIDMAGVDQINVTGNAGADAYIVGRANNGDSGNAVAPTSPYTDPTASLSDLSTTEVRVVNITEAADAADNVFVDGRSGDDEMTVTVESAATSILRISGLPYDIRIAGANTADRLTIRGNEGNDTIKAVNATGAVAQAVESLIGITLAGGSGNDSLSADAILIGGIGNDLLEGGAGDDQLFGNEGEDTMRGGGGNDTFDGGAGFDTILVNGTTGNDVINIVQSAPTTLVHTVNGDVQTDTLALSGTTRTVERVHVVAGDGSDTIQVSWADVLGTDADVNSLRVDVDGGPGATSDRLGVVDLGTGDLVLYQVGDTDDAGAITVGPGNVEPLNAFFTNIERAQPIAAAGGDIVVFKHDPFEFNDARTLATHLGANDAINVDPVINPGLDPNFALPADQDWYRVVAERTGVLDFQVYFRQVGTLANGRPGLPNSGNLDIDVTDAAGNVITGFGTNDATNDERVRIPAVAGQTYYLRVFANGTAINNYNITVDNYAPPTPTDLELLDNPVGDTPPANSDTGRNQFDNITRDNTPTIVFRLDDAIFLNDLPGNNATGTPPDEVIPIAFQAAAGIAGYRIAIFDEGSSPAPGTQVGTAPQTPLGFATFVSAGVYQFTTPVLADGSHFLTARVQMIDPATAQQSGFGPRSTALEIVVDTVNPPAFFGQINLADKTQGLDAASDSGVVGVPATSADRVTNVTQPSFYGRAEANTVVRLFVESNGIAGLQSTGATPDLFLGLTATTPLDGTNQFPGGQWSFTTPLDLNNPALGFTKDGLRVVYVTGEDVAGNTTTDAAADVLNIFLDTAGPQVTAVQITGSPAYNLFGIKPGNALQGPTPSVNGLTINVRDLPNRSNVDPNFLYAALQSGVATTPGNFVLTGDHSGVIAIKSITFVGNATSNGDLATGSLQLTFNEPLPDDRYTLSLKDTIVDPVGNKLDGESNAAEPNGGPGFPSGDSQPGRDFVARFTVDSRPEVGTVSQGLVYVDINGNFVFDPEGQDNDATNRDFVFQFGTVTDGTFAGNFANRNTGIASGFDKLGVYGKFNGVYSFMLDTDDDGVGDVASNMPAGYQVNGIPVAGNFSAAHGGDEIGLFDGKFWYLDLNGNNKIEIGERIASNANGLPIVGDFNGDGKDDLALFNNDTNVFTFDVDRNGTVDDTWAVQDDIQRFKGLSGFTDRPVAGDLNLDGIDDIGLWVKGRQGVVPESTGEFFFWVSDVKAALPSAVFEAYSPSPLGNDLFAHYGNELALPVFGNFDPPTVSSNSSQSSGLTNPFDSADVNRDGVVSPLDALVVINTLARGSVQTVGSQAIRFLATNGGNYVDVSGDGAISPIDVLQVINRLNRRSAIGSGEGESLAPSNVDSAIADGLFAGTDNPIEEMLVDSSWINDIKKRRG